MCANSLNLFTLSTLILFAARVFGVAEFNWLTILTPYLLGEITYQGALFVIWRYEQTRKQLLAKEFAEIIARTGEGDKK